MRHRSAVVMMSRGCRLGAALPPRASSSRPPFAKTVNLSGPRFGITALSTGVVDELHKRSIDVGSNISQFGWQFEKAVLHREAAAWRRSNEWVVLLGGLDQGVALPSRELAGRPAHPRGRRVRHRPNITPAGVALARGRRRDASGRNLNVPMNVAVVPSKVGTRISVLTGFSMRRR